jgi:hypothetical protein
MVQMELCSSKPKIGSFGCALEEMEKGKCVARLGWNGKGMYIFKVKSSVFNVNKAPLLGIFPEGTSIEYQAHIDMKTVDNSIVPWLASQSDIQATDWVVVK